MALFKVYGERSSGTTFLVDLLKKNNIPQIHHNVYCDNTHKPGYCTEWKHGLPNVDLKKKHKTLVDIVIFREINSWLVSMYKNPQINMFKVKSNNFKDFLCQKKKNDNSWLNYEDKTPINKDDDNKTIFEIRYYKFKEYEKYKNINNNVIFVSLTYLQDESNCKKFLQAINDKYSLNIKNFTCNIKFHTKSHLCINKTLINRKYDVNISNYKNLIEENINSEIENYLNNLSYEIFNYSFE